MLKFWFVNCLIKLLSLHLWVLVTDRKLLFPIVEKMSQIWVKRFVTKACFVSFGCASFCGLEVLIPRMWPSFVAKVVQIEIRTSRHALSEHLISRSCYIPCDQCAHWHMALLGIHQWGSTSVKHILHTKWYNPLYHRSYITIKFKTSPQKWLQRRVSLYLQAWYIFFMLSFFCYKCCIVFSSWIRQIAHV